MSAQHTEGGYKKKIAAANFGRHLQWDSCTHYKHHHQSLPLTPSPTPPTHTHIHCTFVMLWVWQRCSIGSLIHKQWNQLWHHHDNGKQLRLDWCLFFLTMVNGWQMTYYFPVWGINRYRQKIYTIAWPAFTSRGFEFLYILSDFCFLCLKLAREGLDWITHLKAPGSPGKAVTPCRAGGETGNTVLQMKS